MVINCKRLKIAYTNIFCNDYALVLKSGANKDISEDEISCNLCHKVRHLI